MEVFKIAKRLKPRRVYKVQAAHEVPPRPTAPGPSGSPASPGIGRQWGAVFTGLVAPMGIYLALTMAPQGAGPTGPGSTPGRSTSRTEVAQATKTTLDEKGTRTARSPGQLRAPSRPVIELDPSGKLLKDARRIVFRLRSDPTTQGNLKERLDMLEKLFYSIDETDRIAIYGSTDYDALRLVILSYGDKSPQAMDHFLTQMRLVLF